VAQEPVFLQPASFDRSWRICVIQTRARAGVKPIEEGLRLRASSHRIFLRMGAAISDSSRWRAPLMVNPLVEQATDPAD
jgi:hypothetical protein